MAWSKLHMRCPHCGSYSGHEVLETAPKLYRWDDEASAFFKKNFDEDISFRERRKGCKKCSKSFWTVEFSKEFLQKMIRQLIRQDKDLASRQEILDKCREEGTGLYSKMRAIHKLSNTKKK